VIAFIFEFESKFFKLSDGTANVIKSTDYFINQQNCTAIQKNSTTEKDSLIIINHY